MIFIQQTGGNATRKIQQDDCVKRINKNTIEIKGLGTVTETGKLDVEKMVKLLLKYRCITN